MFRLFIYLGFPPINLDNVVCDMIINDPVMKTESCSKISV